LQPRKVLSYNLYFQSHCMFELFRTENCFIICF
jgi:hypothetical protein